MSIFTRNLAAKRFPLALAIAFGLMLPHVLVAATNTLGATLDSTGKNVTFRIVSSTATRIEVWIYDQPLNSQEKTRLTLTKDQSSQIWSVTAPLRNLQAAGSVGLVYYGFRAWGPNWIYSPTWVKGTAAGFKQDVDAQGNRFNPNKLLLDPYALEVSHDPLIPTTGGGQTSASIYNSGAAMRNVDTGTQAPKGVLTPNDTSNTGTKPARAFKDDIIYEVHLRGLTKNDSTIPAPLRGTYAGAALKAAYLKRLGVTAVEFLPLQEFQNDTNDIVASTAGDNYWGYDPYNYFSPDKRYAADQRPAGVRKEFKSMVKAFHDQGLKVFVDVVYNHTGEGNVICNGDPTIARVFSWRGLGNAAYYELADDARCYVDNNGVGPNVNTANETTRNLIMDSLRYWKEELGVDGFRFDLAPVLGNACQKACFSFSASDSESVINRALAELPARPVDGGDGVDLIAEPWALGDGTYQLGAFPANWAAWNDKFRDAFRRAQNKLGVDAITPAELATRFAGSSNLFQKPSYSVNFMVAHDGFTLRDLYTYNTKMNDQAWDKGPSDGGSDNNISWDQGGVPALQRQAARTALGVLMVSAGVPMITGGDEMYRTQFGNNNTYNLDSPANWLDYQNAVSQPNFFNFAVKLMAFRNAHAALRPAAYFTGTDHNANSLVDIRWLRSDGQTVDAGYFQDPSQHFLAFRIDGSEFGDSVQSIYVGYNGWSGPVTVTLPGNIAGKRWYRVSDTASWMENQDNFNAAGAEELLNLSSYEMHARSLLLLIEK